MTTPSASRRGKPQQATTTPAAPKTRAQTLIDLMQSKSGASAAELAAAVGWQVHSVRGFIAGTLKKRSDLIVTTAKRDGITRYSVSAAVAP